MQGRHGAAGAAQALPLALQGARGKAGACCRAHDAKSARSGARGAGTRSNQAINLEQARQLGERGSSTSPSSVMGGEGAEGLFHLADGGDSAVLLRPGASRCAALLQACANTLRVTT